MVAKSQTTVINALDRAAARQFYAIGGVEEVRRQDDPDGVTFRILGHHLSEEALENLVAAEIDLATQFPQAGVLIKVHDRFDAENIQSASWERLPLVKPSSDFVATASTAGGGESRHC